MVYYDDAGILTTAKDAEAPGEGGRLGMGGERGGGVKEEKGKCGRRGGGGKWRW